MVGLATGGIRQFKEGFGGEEIEYVGARDLPLRAPMDALVRVAIPAYGLAQRTRNIAHLGISQIDAEFYILTTMIQRDKRPRWKPWRSVLLLVGMCCSALHRNSVAKTGRSAVKWMSDDIEHGAEAKRLR